MSKFYKIKKITFLVSLLLSTSFYAQENTEIQESTLENIFEVNYNFLGFGFSYEHVLSKNITVKGELSYEGGIFFDEDSSDFILAPSLSAEGRYYYNLAKRENKGLNLKNNSGNFISLKAQYFGDYATINSSENISIYNQFYLAPMWNISRNFGKSNFGYEVGIGAGYGFKWDKDYSTIDFILPLNLKISYKL